MTYIDLHTHGLAGRDCRSKDADDYLRLAESYKSHGTDAFLPTLFPAPIPEMREVLTAIKAAMEMQNINPPLPPFGKGGVGGFALILGVHLEGPFVNPDKAGALGGENFLPATPDNLARLIDGFEDMIKIVTIAPELPGALSLIEELSALGIRVNMGHSAATSAQARDGKSAGATGITHLFNAMSGMHHREPGLAGFALTDDDLYVEIIADLAHVHPDAIRLVLKCKPKDKIILVSDSLYAAKTPGSPEFGPLYLPDGKTLAGSGITLMDAVRNIESLGISSSGAALFASVNPRSYIALKD